MTEPRARRPSARTWTVLAVVLTLVAVVALVVAITGQQSAPQPSAAAGEPTTTAASSTTSPPSSDSGPPAATSSAPATGPTTPAEPVADPVSVSIPSIDVTSDLLRLGLQGDGTVEVPPLAKDDKAGWYTRGPAPGALGPAILLGHIDSARWGPGIFFELGALEPGDEVDVTRKDGSVAVFTVDRVEQYPKDDFPTVEVYGNTDDPQLRLITCGGDFDASVRSYEDNIVAFASLTDTRPA